MSQLNFRIRKQVFLEKHFSGDSIDYRQIISLFIPMLIDQAFLVCLNLLNIAMISSSGVAAVSAVSMIDTLNILLISVFVAVSTGGTVVVAQYKGSGSDLMVSKAAASSISLVSSLAFCISLFIVLFHSSTLNFLFGTASAEVFGHAQIYLIGSSISYMGFAIVESICGAMRGIGKSRVSLTLSLIMNLSYVLLNIVFVNFLDMGVLGMTIAVNVARYSAAIFALIYLAKMDATLHVRIRDMLVLNLSMLKRILFIGIPFAVEQVFFNGGKMLTQVFIVSLGTYAMATNAISASLAALFLVPSIALSQTIVTVVGQCMGRQNVKDARKFARSFLWLSSFSLLLMGLIVIPLFQPIVSLFHPPDEIVNDIFIIILITAIVQIPLWPISFLLPSALRAAGDSKFTSITSMLSMWLFRVTLGYVLGVVLQFGIIGVWLAMNSEWGVRGAAFLWRFRGQKWYKHRLIEPNDNS
ncbi:MATE family efflux transporter [Paenibacillus sp. FSL H8-0034]|uniref:MATE family efflux transporter n=1 Tax=Paenibacillus sp. FSL H8-0034 TaxID=2954671 RepID=UPI0030F5BD08